MMHRHARRAAVLALIVLVLVALAAALLRAT